MHRLLRNSSPMVVGVVLTLCQWNVLHSTAAETIPGDTDQLNPTAVLNYFTGEWIGTGTVSKDNVLRLKAEWDLHHTIVVERLEWLANGTPGTSLLIHKWDAVTGRLRVNWFSMRGDHADFQLRIEPHNRYFKLIGTLEGSVGGKKASGEISCVVDDASRFTRQVSVQVVGEETKQEWTEEFKRIAPTGASK